MFNKKQLSIIIAGLFTSVLAIAQTSYTPVFNGEAAGSIILDGKASKQEPTKVEAPKVEKPAKVEAPKVEKPAKVEAPKVEKPAKVEAPKVEKPAKVEAPKVEKPAKVESKSSVGLKMDTKLGSAKSKFEKIGTISFKTGSMHKVKGTPDYSSLASTLAQSSPDDVIWVKGYVTADEAQSLNVEEIGVHRADTVRKALIEAGFKGNIRILHSKEADVSQVKVFVQHK